MKKFKRNDPCPCGSGKKYKKCHYLIKVPEVQKDTEDQHKLNLIILEGAINWRRHENIHDQD